MKRLVPFLIVLGFLIPGWRNDQSRLAVNSSADTGEQTKATLYPMVIDGGTKIVYQFGYMTPDKGLKLYFDTIPYPKGGLKVDESLRRRLSMQ